MTWNSNKFRVEELLGKGCFGEVFAARDLSEDKPCAIKKISVTKLAQPSCSPRQAEHNRARAKDLLLSEVQTLIALNTNKRSDHIVGYFECGLEAEAGIDNLSNALKSAAINASVSSGESITNCQNDCFFYIKMELCHTNLKNWMDELPNQEDRIRKISTIRDIWRQVLVGLDFMHHRNVPIIHRDLKPDNVFINVYEGNVQVKIGDFGLSTQLLMNAFQKQSKVGSDRYASPEMLFRTGSYDTKTDIFSAGLIFYESLRVFQTEDDLIESFSNIKLEREGLLDSFSSGHNLDAELHLIRRMVSVKPENRPHARYLLQKAFKNQKGTSNVRYKSFIFMITKLVLHI
jgi:translation initiation factor 2-alpha kinase 4